jgi:hypothetical protein
MKMDAAPTPGAAYAQRAAAKPGAAYVRSAAPKPGAAYVLAALVALWVVAAPAQSVWLFPAKPVAPGVDLFRSNDASLVSPPGAVSVHLLRLDPERVRLDAALSNGEVLDAERVIDIAARHQAIAAVNAGFFNIKNGEPTGVLKIGGELVSDSTLARGIVAIRSRPGRKPELEFEQASVRMSLVFKTSGKDGKEHRLAIDGLDTTRERGKLMLYTPSYNEDTDTAASGTEFVVAGRPLAVTEIRRNAGRTPIPRGGAVLSFGGLELPPDLAALVVGTRVAFEPVWRTINGLSPSRLDEADHIVNGAGLLKRNGQAMTNWREVENLNPATFLDVRHPRTIIGVDRRGFIWLIVVDGRQPGYSLGMTFAEMIALADRLELRDALNLDGGGSTTMVVKGMVVNKPSDPAGARAVSDAIIVR